MDIKQISVGKNPRRIFTPLIEIPLGGVPVKYEIDKKSGALFVDRFLHTAMFYPGNYGFIPHTPVAGRRPVRHHRRRPGAGGAGRGDPLPSGRRAGDGGRRRRRREDPRGPGRRTSIPSTPTSATTATCRRSCASRWPTSSSTTRTWKRASGSPSRNWLDVEGAEQLVVEAIERAKGPRRQGRQSAQPSSLIISAGSLRSPPGLPGMESPALPLPPAEAA